MQMLYVCDCTSGEYVSDKRWLQASPPDCPRCKPKGRCSLVRHGFYARLQPQGTMVRRFRCKASGRAASASLHCRLRRDWNQPAALRRRTSSCPLTASAVLVVA